MTCDRIVILAAGRATRMKKSAESATTGFEEAWKEDAMHRPKPMIRVGRNGEPMIQLILEQAIRAGFTEATIVLSPQDQLTRDFLEGWNASDTGVRLRMGWAVQGEPRGTGDAVRCALEQDPVPPGAHWVLANGDNLPSRAALAKLRSACSGQALLGYDRECLGLPMEKTAAFAVIESAQGRVHRIVEKPEQARIEQLAKLGPVHVSMNYFKLDATIVLPFLERLAPHPIRGEWELPTALQSMMEAGHPVEVIPMHDRVLDLTQLQDVTAVQQGLDLLESFELEICASTPMDVACAAEHGAHRVELCAHWECGGLTPTESDVKAAVQTGIPVHALIRPRAGHFHYSPSEWESMTRQIEGMLSAGANRVVIGALDAEGRFESERIQAWVDRFGAHRLVIHRALDASTNWREDLKRIGELGVHRILSSGASSDAWAGRENIAYAQQCGFHVTVASGVRPVQKKAWLEQGIHSFHASCRRIDHVETRFFEGTTHPVDGRAVEAWF